MSNGEVNKIISNEYADLIIEYGGNLNVLNNFQGREYTIIDDRLAIVHIPVEEINAEFIKKYGWFVLPLLGGLCDTSSLEASGISKVQSIPNFLSRGQDILVGFLDTGIEYTNQVFKNADNTTRIVSIWDQTIENANQQLEGFPYGSVYTREQINLALQSDNPLNIVPSTDDIGHGTTLAGITAGSNIEEQNFVGVVPNSEIVVVKLKYAKQYLRDFYFIPDNVVVYQSTDLHFAVKYLITVAKSLKKPIAICISVGTSQSAHNGRGAFSSYLDYLGEVAGVAIAIAAGNEGNSGGHYYGIVDKTVGYDTVELKIGKDMKGFSMELWGYSPNIYSIDILSPSGEYIPRIPARIGTSRQINFIFDRTIIYIDYQILEAQTGNQLILIRFQTPTEGIWKFRVYASGSLKMDYHIWLPIKQYLESETFFIKPNAETTITSPGNVSVPITVTAYNHRDQSLYLEASRGYTATNVIKPDIAAPGVNVYGPALNNKFTLMSGTSVAAAHTTGVTAMMLEWGIIKGNMKDINSYRIKNMLIRGAKRNPDLSYPNKEWGYGILDIYNTFEVLRGGGL